MSKRMTLIAAAVVALASACGPKHAVPPTIANPPVLPPSDPSPREFDLLDGMPQANDEFAPTQPFKEVVVTRSLANNGAKRGTVCRISDTIGTRLLVVAENDEGYLLRLTRNYAYSSRECPQAVEFAVPRQVIYEQVNNPSTNELREARESERRLVQQSLDLADRITGGKPK